MPKNFIGRIGEDCVARYIKSKHGWEILGRNVRLRTGEIDIVAKTHNTIIFIEVKAGLIPMGLENSSGCSRASLSGCSALRAGNEELRPEQHVDFRKAQKLRVVCREYLLANKYSEETDWRIDIAAVAVDDEGGALVRYYPNAVGDI